MDLTELLGRFGSSRSNSKPNYLLSRSPSTITVAVIRSCSELYHNLARESKRIGPFAVLCPKFSCISVITENVCSNGGGTPEGLAVVGRNH
ncbi:hypothetical protein DY000_02056959 [Brassica cretica]|uniref:Uncharacterized protein n=1 Tax=Brassica cretica TaxID=69181 RepID=A0ABQ7AMG6_BRACR|nr:hypothetical protein DY000_02056959 [Brassica cretica]